MFSLAGVVAWGHSADTVFSDDMYAPESVELLQKSGIELQRHEEVGIEPNDFAELMITSGLVLSEDVKWISFHRYVLPLVFNFPCDVFRPWMYRVTFVARHNHFRPRGFRPVILYATRNTAQHHFATSHITSTCHNLTY